MVDSMCSRKNCPRAETCLRITMKPKKYQSYACFDVTKDAKNCIGYVDNKGENESTNNYK